MNNTQTIIRYRPTSEIAILQINSPTTLNALNSAILEELNTAIDEISKEKEVKVVIITGVNKAFVAGADIKQMAEFNKAEALEFSRLGCELFRKIATMNNIVIASVNGYALGGGCELAMACDIRIASTKAKFGQPEITLGIIPGFSGMQRLVNLVGYAKAKELIYTGKMIDSNEALSIGLVNKIVESEKLKEETLNLAEQIAKNPLSTLLKAKELFSSCYYSEKVMGKEMHLFSECFETFNQKEGMQAFIEKRKANFK
ncbi:MAG: enoyl-CoA hydratase-related protein [Bacteroidota bacterium]|nr:enoyl-CoA hydratase-related protein [Bacteroidota bacterium]